MKTMYTQGGSIMDAQNTRQQNVNGGEGRERLKIEVDAEPFNGIATTKYITSNDLGKAATELFKGVFADCEGCTFDVVGNVPTLAVIFNHGVYDKGARVACTREATVDSNAGIVARIRTRDHLLANGDRYYLTDDGKDAFRDLLNFQVYNNGKPNWGKIVCEFSENSQQRFYGMNTPQYTKVGFIDLNKIAGLIWCTEIDGDNVEYDVHIVRALNSGVPGMPPSNYMLAVTRVSSRELQNTYEKLGFGSFSSIIR
jgi:hypothetical protein